MAKKCVLYLYMKYVLVTVDITLKYLHIKNMTF